MELCKEKCEVHNCKNNPKVAGSEMWMREKAGRDVNDWYWGCKQSSIS